MDAKLKPHIDDVARVLGNKISKDEIAKELENYIRIYRVSIEDAKRSIVKKFGGGAVRFEIGVDKKLAELKGNETNVNILCRVVSVNQKEIDSNGSKKEIFYGILGDETTTVPFTAWETESLKLERGDVIRVQNAYTKEWMGKVQVYFGTRANIKHESKDAVPYPRKTTNKISDLEDGMRGVSVAARILSVEKREVDVSGQKKTVFSGLLGDKSGKIQFSAWADFKLNEDDVVQIESAYIKSWRGIPQLTFDEKSMVQKLKVIFPNKEEIMRGSKLHIGDIEGGVDLLVEGVMVDVKDGSGLIYRCPECNRAVKKGVCSIHGTVDATPDLRIKGVLDDGTGAMTTIFGREITESLLKKDLDDCLQETRNSPNPDIIKDRLHLMLVSQPMRLRGNVLRDDFGLMMIVDSAEFLKINLKDEAKELLTELET